MAKKVELKLDVSSIISDYRAAISAMEAAGAKANITQGLTKSLDRLEEKFKSLEVEGAFGKTGSREIANYQARVDKTFSSLGQLGKELERIKKDKKSFPTSALAEFEKKLKEVQQALATMQQAYKDKFTALGFSQEQAEKLALEVKNEKEVEAELKKEVDLRNQNVLAMKAEYDAAVKKAGVSVTSGGKGASLLTSANVNRQYTGALGFNQNEVAQITSTLNASFRDLIRQGKDFEEVWAGAMRQTVIGEDEIEEYVRDIEGLKSRIQEVIDKRDALSKGAQENYFNAIQSRDQIGNYAGSTDGNPVYSEQALSLIEGTTAALEQMARASADVTEQESRRSTAEARDQASMESLNDATVNLASNTESLRSGFNNSAQSFYQSAKAAESASASFDQMTSRLLTLLSATSVLNLFKRTVKETYEDVKELDKSFASIAMVTKYSVNQMWDSYSQYADMASQLGQKTNDIIQASALFYQQGLDTNEALALTTDTMKLATLAGNDFSTATQEMTSAIRGFKMEMDEGGRVADVYSNLAAHAAATVDDIAQAMARTASIANSAGMSFENTSAFLTQMIETTQESAENIGTSLKTIIARFTELKENVAGTEDSSFDDLEYNKVDKALKSVGVSLKDVNGQFRNLDDVFLELSEKWDSLDRNTQRYVATIAAGSRQQSRFIAMMDNYERTAQLMEYAADAEGKADEQFAKYADTMEYKLNQLSTKWEEFRVNALDSDFFKGAIDSLSAFLDRLKNVDLKRVIAVAPFAIWAAKTFITNFIATVKAGAAMFQSIGTLAAKKITDGFKKTKLGMRINAYLDQEQIGRELAQAQIYLDKFKQKYGKVNLDIAANIDPTSIKTGEQYLTEYCNAVVQASNNTITYDEALEQVATTYGVTLTDAQNYTLVQQELGNALRDTGNKAGELSNKIGTLGQKQKNAQVAAQSISQAFTQIGAAATMAFSAMFTGGASFEEAMGIMFKSLVATTAQMAIQWVSLAITNRAGATAAGEAVGEGIDAGLAATGVGLIIVAITMAIAGIILLITSMVKKFNKQKKGIDEQLAEAEKKAQESEKLANSSKESKANAEKELTNAKALREEYEKLANKANRNAEEQERYNELVDQIRNELPEVVLSYNEITGELITQNDLWDDIIKKADEAAKMANRNNYANQIKAIQDRQEVINLQFESATKSAQEYRDAFKDIQEYNKFSVLRNQNGYSQYVDVGIAEWLDDFYGKDIKSGNLDSDDIEGIIDTLRYNSDYGKSGMNDFGEWLGQLQKEGNADMNKILKGMLYLGDGFEESNNVNAQYLKEYMDANDSFIAKQEEVRDKELEGLDKSAQAQKALLIKSQLNVSDAVANFMAGMLSTDAAKQEIEDAGKQLFKDAFGFKSTSAMSDYADDWHGGSSDNLKSWGSLKGVTDKNGISAVDVINQINAMNPDGDKITESSWNDKRKDDEDWKDYIDELENFNAAYQALVAEKQAYIAELTEKEQEAVEKFYGSANDLSQADLENAKNSFVNSMETDAAKEFAEKEGQKFVDALKDKITTEAQKFNLDEKVFSDWTTRELSGLDSAYATLSEKSAEGAGEFVKRAMDVFKNTEGMTKNQLLQMLQFDWDKIDLTNVKDYSEKIVDIFKDTLGEDKAKEIAEEFIEEATKAGVASFGVKSQETIDSMMDTIGDGIEKWIKGYSGLSDAITAQLKDGFISFTQSKEVEKALAELGLDAADYLTYNDNGTIVLNEEKLTKAFKDRVKDQDYILETAQAETKAKIDELWAQVDLLESERDSIVASKNKLVYEKEITKEKYKQQLATLWGTDAAAQGKELWDNIHTIDDEISGINKDITSVNKEYDDRIKAIKEDIQAYQQGLKNIKPGTREYIEAQNKIAAGMREIDSLRNSYLPDEEKVKSVADAEKDRAEALKKLADAEKDVADKQEKLNDKIKEYNELLNGKDNRKSTLDFLYNYDEAINSFNDEISRSKDLLSDAETIQESSEALERYAKATHNLLAEETAKQQVIKAGLENYAKMIENGSYSYTNRETGETTNINFGDYARKDERTGKYVIDQRLINEARFTDEIKDLLEEQVSTYNKYSEEYLKSQDNVRKAEKALQEERKAALSNYVKMETEIAEALKNQYKEEVDSLKDKYDAMKDADDDYLDALQDAIDKQRKLRDQENAYEDLAQKEKKLSLMQRDTSGSNELETRKLEEEIQQDRESLLDQAIDNVIDGLSKLYESQQELRDEEMELKNALLDNTLYWNQQAEALAGSFESAEEYASFLSSLSEEYAMMTLAQQQLKLQEYGESYTAATEYMAIQAMDTASETGDYITETMSITGEEVGEIVATTAETFTTEVTRSYNETTAAFEEDMRKAEQSIDDAKESLNEAIQKLRECADEANKASQALLAAQAAAGAGGGGSVSTPIEETLLDWVGLRDTIEGMTYRTSNNGSSKTETLHWAPNTSFTHAELANDIQKLYKSGESNELKTIATSLGLSGDGNTKELYDRIKERLIEDDYTLDRVFKFKEGGYVNYTGPAWVDGSPDKPEAFLSAEDTERIGNAAKILADIPWMDRDTDNTSVVTNNGGDVSVEINLNIDHISSDVDIDEMIERVKDEIVDVARPEGTNVILQQQLG